MTDAEQIQAMVGAMSLAERYTSDPTDDELLAAEMPTQPTDDQLTKALTAYGAYVQDRRKIRGRPRPTKTRH